MVWNFILYLLYGLAFFTLGVAILSRDTRLSELGIARVIWLLAVFGIIHGFHEWFELLEQLIPTVRTFGFSIVRLVTVTTSFLFLLYFGLFLNIITLYGENALKTTPRSVKLLVGSLALAIIVLAIYLDFGTGKDISVRRLVALPGGLLSGVGLILYSRSVRLFSERGAANFILAGAFMCAYAVFTGAIASNVVIPVIDTKIIVLRGICAFMIMLFTIRALSVFSIEQKKIVNEQLLRFSQSEKLTSMGILAAGIAHQINNPLTNASLNLEMLKDMVGGNETTDKKLASIERNIERASVIASELLGFSREQESLQEPVDLREVIKSAMNLLQTQRLRTTITLSLHDVPEISGIYHKLEEVMINLLMNSLDACTEEDSIEIETFSENGNAALMITDTGHGVDDKKVPQVFDPFFTTKEVGKGTGLGLYVCYNIIKQHGGEISMISSAGGGAIVKITIPAGGNND